MSSPIHSSKMLLFWALALVLPGFAEGQAFSPLGTEYSVSGPLPGDQTHPSVSLSAGGGYVVWQDNAVDGTGYGIAAQRLDQNSSAFYGSFRVNQQSVGNQEKPRVVLTSNGGAAIVWQGGKEGHQNVYLRFLSTNGTFTSQGDIRVNTYTNRAQTSPAIAALPAGNVVVAWSSRDQDGSMEGVYARMMSSAGQNIGSPFLVNQYTTYSQRNPAVASLTNGNFIIVWVSENQGLTQNQLQNGVTQARIYGRLYNNMGQALGNEFLINSGSNNCANPSVVGTSDGGFLVAWSERQARPRSWDIYARSFDGAGVAANEAFLVNGNTYGDQYGPQASASGANNLIVWTSMGQDGSWEGVFGRTVAFGALSGPEFQVNTTTIRSQIHPTVSGNGNGSFLVLWSSFGGSGFDLFGQRYSAGQPTPTPFAPWVSALNQSNLLVSWPELQGYALSGYAVYMDGAATPMANQTANFIKVGGLQAASTHTFSIAYLFANGQRSTISAAGSGTTWAPDLTGDGLPDDWQARFWPALKNSDWPAGEMDSDGDGVSNLMEFLAGTDPTNPNSVLKVRMVSGARERRLVWNSEAGSVYQVRVSTDLVNWTNLGSPRFAAGLTDSVVLGSGQGTGYYRVVRVQ